MPSNNATHQAVADMAAILGAGQYAARLCPSCEGGAARERSLSLDVGSNGVVKFYCHRASCEFKGSIYAGAPIGPQPGSVPQERGNQLTAELFPLTDEDTEWFKLRFHFDPGTAVQRTHSRYALPIYRPTGVVRGYITRRPWDGSPLDTAANRNDSQHTMKALTYLDTPGEAVQSWYGPLSVKSKEIVLVEDQVSAMRLADHLAGKRLVCALLGTGINAQKVLEMQQLRASRVTIALDADATGQAFAMARKWGSAFEACRVVVLPCDIKDMKPEQLDAFSV